MYAITGATGQLGRLVIDALLKTVAPGDIVAAVRAPDKAADLAARGIVVRLADYDRPETLADAFAGVDKVLLISSNEVIGRLPQHQAVIDAAGRAGVRRLAYTSMLHADTSPAKLAVEHRLTEDAIRASGIPFAMLRNGWYIENHLLSLDAALTHGAVVGAAGGGRFSSAARADYAAAAAAVLTDPGHDRMVYELAGDTAFTLADLAAEVARQSGKPVVHKDLGEAEYQALLVGFGLPDRFADVLADADARAGQDAALFDDGGVLSRLIGRPTISMPQVVTAALKG